MVKICQDLTNIYNWTSAMFKVQFQGMGYVGRVQSGKRASLHELTFKYREADNYIVTVSDLEIGNVDLERQLLS
jgi:hypothetical protein